MTAVPTQIPFWHVSPVVHTLPSVQDVLFGRFAMPQMPAVQVAI